MTKSLLFQGSQEEKWSRFYSDVIESSIFQRQIPYLCRYDQNELRGYESIVYSEYIVREIVSKVIKTQASKLSQIKQIVSAYLNSTLIRLNNISHSPGGDQSMSSLYPSHDINIPIACISQQISNRLEEIKAQYIADTVALGSEQLLDLNWKLLKTISSQGKSFVGQKPSYLFKLTIYLKDTTHKTTKKITLQLNKVQLKQFIAQLKTLKAQF